MRFYARTFNCSQNCQFKIHKNEEKFKEISSFSSSQIKEVFHSFSFLLKALDSLAEKKKNEKKKSKREASSNLIVVQLLIWIQKRKWTEEWKKTSQNAKQNNISFALLFTFLFK